MNIPDKLYIGLHADWYYGWLEKKEPPVKEVGLLRSIQQQFDHASRKHVYLATTFDRALAYAKLYANPMVIEVDAVRLDDRLFSPDPDDFPLSDGSPGQIRYGDDIPSNLIKVYYVQNEKKLFNLRGVNTMRRRKRSRVNEGRRNRRMVSSRTRRNRSRQTQESVSMGINIADDAVNEIFARLEELKSQRPVSADERDILWIEDKLQDIVDGLRVAMNM